jgi:hypothetical protein
MSKAPLQDSQIAAYMTSREMLPATLLCWWCPTCHGWRFKRNAWCYDHQDDSFMAQSMYDGNLITIAKWPELENGPNEPNPYQYGSEFREFEALPYGKFAWCIYSDLTQKILAKGSHSKCEQAIIAALKQGYPAAVQLFGNGCSSEGE